MSSFEPGDKRRYLSTWAPLKNTGYDPNARGGLEKQEYNLNDPDKLDYPPGYICFTSLPSSVDPKVVAEGITECLLDGPDKRAIIETPGFPAPLDRPTPACYAVRKAGDKGLGVFAVREIKQGSLVLAERPLIIAPASISFSGISSDLTEEETVRAALVHAEEKLEYMCSRMGTESLEKYKALANCHKTDGSGLLFGIQRTNGFGLTIKDHTNKDNPESKRRQYSCVGADASRLNHSCAPNVVYTFNQTSFCIELTAMRRIAKGEEITVKYGEIARMTAERQEYLQRSYGFTCTCAWCKDPFASDLMRYVAMKNPLPKTSEGAASAEAVLAHFDKMGLHGEGRYVVLLQRVAKIQRKAGNVSRADELDDLVWRLRVAFVGRDFKKPK